jgi:hypothetical protein
MEVTNFKCVNCGSLVEETVQKRGYVCFKCHVKGIRLGFTHGKEAFSGPTIGEIQRKTEFDAKAKGLNIEPVGSRWI